MKQWFFEVVVPEYRIEDAARTRIVGLRPANDGLGQGDAWEVRVRVRNAGTGRMPVEIAAARGERFPDEEEEESGAPGRGLDTSPGTVQAAAPSVVAPKPTQRYEDARTTLTLDAGESQEVVIRCEFEPERVLVDPDALVLQLQRKLAVHRF